MNWRDEAVRDLAVFERVGCQYIHCPGPDTPPVDMATCHVDWRIYELRALLSQTP